MIGSDVRLGSSKATDASVPKGILKTGTLRFAGFLNKGKLMSGMMMDGWALYNNNLPFSLTSTITKAGILALLRTAPAQSITTSDMLYFCMFAALKVGRAGSLSRNVSAISDRPTRVTLGMFCVMLSGMIRLASVLRGSSLATCASATSANLKSAVDTTSQKRYLALTQARGLMEILGRGILAADAATHCAMASPLRAFAAPAVKRLVNSAMVLSGTSDTKGRARLGCKPALQSHACCKASHCSTT
ncbi:hypothetical protein COO60DRAFT_1500468, partial [Scenedesmus sp. NREL 46B-D3]